MQIKCPECGFTRKVNTGQIPAGSSFATCPKCATRFRFRAEPGPEEAAPSMIAGDLPEDESPKEGDIWASMDKMRRDWEEVDREEEARQNESRRQPEDGGSLREEPRPDYQRGGKIPFLSAVGSVPWEYRGGFLNPLVFLRTAILMVTRAPQFFSGINPDSSVFPAWVFLLVARGVQTGVAAMNTQLISTMPDGSQQIVSVLDVLNIPVLIFVSVCMITFLHFLGSFIVNYTIRTLTGARASFRLTFKVMAYAHMPVMLSVIPGVGSLIGLFASLSLLFVGIRHAYGFSWRKTAISVLPYLILLALFLMMFLQAAISQG